MGRSRKPKDKRSEIIISFGGLHNFMISHGVKPWNPDAREEAEKIIKVLIGSDDDSGAEGNESEILDEDEKEDRQRAKIIKSYGGIENFMESHGLKPREPIDHVVAENIIEAMIGADEPSKNSKKMKKKSDGRKGESDKHEEKMAKIINRSGGIEDFMLDNGSLPWEPDDYHEAKQLVEAIIDNEEYKSSEDEGDYRCVGREL
jgi:hypothetical protein